jgi:hypothetical protein
MTSEMIKIEKQITLLKAKKLCLELGFNPCSWKHFKLCADMVVLNECAN